MNRSIVMAGLTVALFALALGTSAHGAPRPPLVFEANQGQTDSEVRFLGRGDGYTFFLTSNAAVLGLHRSKNERAVVRMTLVGADPSPAIVGEAELPAKVSYYRSGDPPRRVTDVPTYARVRYIGIYSGVDLVYHSRERQLEYDFIVAPGADPGPITLAFEGADRVTVDDRGDLVLHTAAGELRQPRPVIYQEVEGIRRMISGDYSLAGPGRVGIRLGAYDASRAVVIDPVLDFSTFLGGSGDERDELYGDLGVGAVRVAVDTAGNAYVTGTTASTDFPTTPGEDGIMDGNLDAFVTKLSPTGAVVYSTYLGGPCDDMALGIAVDATGNAYVTGRAHDRCSLAVPTGVLAAKLDPDGAVLYFFTFGHSLADSSVGLAVAADGNGNAYVAGHARGSSRDFPTTPGAFRATDCGVLPDATGPDGFVAKVSAAGTAILYSTYLCGNAYDSVNAIAVDGTGHAYVTGSTTSKDFPTRNAYQASHPGWGADNSSAFVAKLLPDGSDLVYSTYLGGRFDSEGAGIAVDAQGNAYVTGTTDTDDFPTTAGVLQPEPGARGCLESFCVSDAFVTKLSATGSNLVYSTYLFGESKDEGKGIAVDAAGNAYVAGMTDSLFFPILDAFQATKRGLTDAFVAKLNPDATRLVYSSYLGGGARPGSGAVTEGWDAGLGIALHAATGTAYVVGYTNSFNFPTTPGAFQPNLGGVCWGDGTPCGDAFVSKITAGGPGIVPLLNLSVTPTEVPPGGTITATWAGLPAPSPNDELRLYTLGSLAGAFEEVASWPTTGAANGTLQLTLPNPLVPGIHTYELRVLSSDPEFSNLLGVMARSHPIRVGTVAASVDLVIAGVVVTPAQPAAGQPVDVAVTVTNQGTAAAGAFALDVYKHRTTAPVPGTPGDAQCPVASLAPGAAVACTRTVTYATAGAFSLWAQVDTAQTIPEANEANNVSGPRPITVAAAPPSPADLVVVAVSDPPASALPGGRFSVSDTVSNRGDVTATPSSTRYYLSLDVTKNPGDTLLTGARAVPALAPAVQSQGTVLLTVPLGTPPAIYRLLTCADDTALVAEGNEANNCLAAVGPIIVGHPDLVVTAVSNPPAAARPGTSFTVTDTVLNNSPAATAKSSTTRYYLSLDGAKSTTDKLLTGSRTVPILAGSAQFPGSAKTVTIPTTTPPASYFLLACADDAKVIGEGNESNNCLASATRVTLALPDLSLTTVSNPGGPFPRGASFTVSDTVVNGAPVDTGEASTTRYYLSLNGTKDKADRRLTGSRAVPILGPASERFGLVTVTIPSTTVPGTYVLFACADDLRAIDEASETNNCRASGTAIEVTP